MIASTCAEGARDVPGTRGAHWNRQFSSFAEIGAACVLPMQARANAIMGIRGFFIDHSGSSNYAARLPDNCKSVIVRQSKFYLTHAGCPQLPEIVNNPTLAAKLSGSLFDQRQRQRILLAQSTTGKENGDADDPRFDRNRCQSREVGHGNVARTVRGASLVVIPETCVAHIA